MREMMEALLLCPIFQNLTKQEIEEIFQNLKYTKHSYSKNEIIYNAGDTARHIAVIIAGDIEIRKYLSSGNRLSVFQRTKGEVLGGSIMFSSTPQYPCEVIAKEKSQLVFIEKSYVLQAFFNNETVAANILQISANRIMQLEKKIELFSFYSIQKKIAFSLLHDFEYDGGSEVTIPFSKTTWAESLNVSRTSLSRELKHLCEQGIIKMNGKQIEVLKKEILESLLW